MSINNKDEALQIVDTKVRQTWLETVKQNELLNGVQLGEATIEDEAEFNGHKAYQYHIDGLPMTRDGRKRWVVDTGETIETTLNEDENTLEKAYTKLQSRKAAKLLQVKPDELESAKVDGVGLRFYEPTRGGRSLILGDDGGVLFANSSVAPDSHIQAYKDGKRTPTEVFGQNEATNNSVSSAPEPTESVKLEGVRLLADEQSIAASLSTEALSEYIKSVSEAIETIVKDSPTTFELLLQFELATGKPVTVQISNQGEVSQELLQKINDALLALQTPAISGDPVPFQVHYKVNS